VRKLLFFALYVDSLKLWISWDPVQSQRYLTPFWSYIISGTSALRLPSPCTLRNALFWLLAQTQPSGYCWEPGRNAWKKSHDPPTTGQCIHQLCQGFRHCPMGISWMDVVEHKEVNVQIRVLIMDAYKGWGWGPEQARQVGSSYEGLSKAICCPLCQGQPADKLEVQNEILAEAGDTNHLCSAKYTVSSGSQKRGPWPVEQM